ncbi:hypothetical protein SAMN05444274_101608 [Mariniphaga anaerophila]|uniref:4-O-methyl-glucuronoyl methylesterase-like domain-containing protein n=1 Tax=Mariniphaga anaerophila TaxID=1484053 RepID=A0A1M4U8B2_9BACT|nr:hypothetical protein [Mariniphaga anaerophila]SHE53009.1 hypothetical protein SAMN05444274_101608 [Mariniphaga anaerophila]
MKTISNIFLLTGILFVQITQLCGQNLKWDNNVIYNEAQVPFYELPDPMISIDGKAVNSVEEWEKVRRPQIMAMFAGTLYGGTPIPEQEVEVEYEELSVEPEFIQGRCTRKHLLIKFRNNRGTAKMHMVVYVPNNVNGPVPAMLRVAAISAEGNLNANNIQGLGQLRNGMPLTHFLDRGFALAFIQGGEIIKDEIRFGGETIHKLFYKGKQSMPRADEWGVLGAIAWQASRALDYLETDKDIDSKKVALLGSAKFGQSVLWAAAQDQRFAMALSQCSGAAGAALWRRNYGENLKYMTQGSPRWLCENAQKYVGNEADLPIDQHMLLACIAPRPLYVTSSITNNWSDPMGEYLSTYHATPVYELYGLKGQSAKQRPRINEPVEGIHLSYAIRSAGPGIIQEDWDRYLNFMEFHFKK